jgi:hypothetical protein
LSEGLRTRIHAHKLEIISELRRQATAARLATGIALPCPSSVLERAAIIQEGDGCDRATADARALAEFRFGSWHELSDAHRARIIAVVEGMPPPANDDGRKLMRFTRSFVDTDPWRQAVAMGWPMVELFGINPHAPLVRPEGWGLVVWMALGRVAGGRLEIAEDRATVHRPNGSTLAHYRGAPALDASVLWWQCNQIIGGRN